MDSWTTLDTHCRQSRLSLSRPIIDPNCQRALVPEYPFESLRRRRASVRARSRYLLRTDLSRFYHSIYTHAISWALHNKAIVKARRRDLTLLGNRLDKILREGQDGQTLGIPVGPDASLLIAEVVLTAVDSRLTVGNSINGFRHYDDFELGFEGPDEAEATLASLQAHLAEYEMSLNPEKTDVLILPAPIDRPWVSALRDATFRDTEKGQEMDLFRYFESAIQLAKAFSEDPVLSYALSRLRPLKILPAVAPVYQDLVLQFVLAEPGALSYGVFELTREELNGHSVDRDKLHSCLESILKRHSLAQHGSEVAWALYVALLFELKISDDAARNISALRDSVVALLALDCKSSPDHSRKVRTEEPPA